jgi:enoyl-CoA hydratase
MPYQHILVDDPRPRVPRITLNRPEKRNALNNLLRAEVFQVLEMADRDADSSISILRGAGEPRLYVDIPPRRRKRQAAA